MTLLDAVLMLLLAAPGGAPSWTVDLLSRHRPMGLELRAGPPGALELELEGPDGRRTRQGAGLLDVRCDGRDGVLHLRTDGASQVAVWLAASAAGGSSSVEVRVPNGPQRRYSGRIEVSVQRGGCRVRNRVSMEDYVESVACGEIRGAESEALRAQAIVSRTYALNARGRHREEGADFCDLTHCQVYEGADACTVEQRQALAAVRGLVLLFEGALAEVAYFSTCAGHTASAADVWGERRARPYLEGVPDGSPPNCRASPHGRWRFAVPRATLCADLAREIPELGFGPCVVDLSEVGRGGWVRRVRLRAAGEVFLSGEEFHLLLGRVYGWNRFRSGNYKVQMGGDRVLFEGRGLGHGVGLCQHGAMGQERQGKNYRQILEFYFPGTEVGPVP